MKKTPDFSAAIAKGAAEAREILEQTGTMIDSEWQRLASTIEESDTVPDQVKQAVDRFEKVMGTARREASTAAEDLSADFSNTVDEMRDFMSTLAPTMVETGRRAARQFGVPVPEAWPWETDDDSTEAGEPDSDSTEKEPAAEKTAAKKPAAAKKSAKKASAKKTAAKKSGKKASAKKTAKKTATKSAKKASAKKTAAGKKTTKKTAKKASVKKTAAAAKKTATKTAKKTAAKKK